MKLVVNPLNPYLFDFIGMTADESARLLNLEDNEIQVEYMEEINASAGAITPPATSTILTGKFPAGLDAYVETITNGRPTDESPIDASGNIITVSSLDASGNYVLSGTPSAYPVMLCYLLKIRAGDLSNLDTSKIISVEDANTYVSQTEAETVSDTTEGNRDNTKGFTARSFRWAFNKMLSSVINVFSKSTDHAINNVGNVSGAINLDLSYPVTRIVLTGNTTITPTNAPTGTNFRTGRLLVYQDGTTGNWTLTAAAGTARGTIVLNSTASSKTTIGWDYSAIDARIEYTSNTDTVAN